MANRNLADEVAALAKGLASLRVRISALSRRVCSLEDRELQALRETPDQPSAAVVRARQLAANIVSSYEDLPSQLKQEPRRTLRQRIRAWWAR